MKLPPPVLSEPRSFPGLALRLGAMAYLPFTLGMAWLISTLFYLEFAEVLPFTLGGGLIFASVYGCTNARHLQIHSVVIPHNNRAAFTDRLHLATTRIGYLPDHQRDNCLWFRPSFQTGWAAGSLVVLVEEGRATLEGPAVFVGKLEQLLGETPS